MLNGFMEKASQKIGIPIVVAQPFSRTQAPAFLQDILKLKFGYSVNSNSKYFLPLLALRSETSFLSLLSKNTKSPLFIFLKS
jgi:hypothetical protein